MSERWVNDFCSMLNYMQSCGRTVHSSIVGFYSDGDGDFRPEFKIDKTYEIVDGYRKDDNKILQELEVIFDAG